MKNLPLLSVAILSATSGLIFGNARSANAALLWNWNYSGLGINASGTFTTENTPDSDGFYLMTGITGTRNGQAIIGLQPTGTSIPGNEPFVVDNLIRPGFPQLTKDGFGYQIADGSYVNPFFASFLPTPAYLEVFSAAPFIPGFENFGPEDSELEISFSATLVPEPSSVLGLLMLTGLGMAMGKRSLKS